MRLAVLAAAVFAAITTEVLPVGLLPQIGQGLGVSASSAGLLVSAYAVVVAVASLPLTAVLARWRRRPVLVALLVVYAASNLGLAATHDYAVAVAARLVGGAAHAAFFSVVITAAVTLVPARRAGRAVALVSTGNTLALALGVPLGTALGEQVGWRWAFVCAALVLVVCAGLVLAVLPTGAAPTGVERPRVLDAARRGPLLGVAVTVVALTLGHYTVYTYITPLLISAGIDPARVSLVLLGYGLAAVVGTLVAGAASDGHLRGALVVTSALLTATLAVLGLLDLTGASAGAATAVVVAWGAVFGALPPLLQTAALRAAPQVPDAAPAVVNATFNVGIAGGALLGAAGLQATSPGVLALGAAPLTAGALVVLALGHRRTRSIVRARGSEVV